jgi:hypothetical protein
MRARPSAGTQTLAAAAIATLTLSACSDETHVGGGGGEIDPGVTIRDSAGVTIVENTTPRWGDGEEWRLAPDPVLSIGVAEGLAEYEFYRANSALQLADGRIVIGNHGTQELRFFDSEGQHLYSAGREGEGPGEFRSIGRVWPMGADSLAIFDYQTFRFSIFSISGEFGRTIRLEMPGGGLALPEGFVDRGRILTSTSVPGTSKPGVHRDVVMYHLCSLDGQVLDSLGRFPGSELYGTEVGGNVSVASRPFGLDAQVAVASDRWYYGSSGGYEIEVHSLDGALERIIRYDRPNRRLTSDVADGYRERTAGTFWARIPTPETLPAYSRLFADDAGNLWVEDYALRDEPATWSVFNPEGRLLGSIEIPPGGLIKQIGADFVLGIWKDELDVEQARMYRLLKDDS